MVVRPLIFGTWHFLSSRDRTHFKKQDIRLTDGLLVRQRALSLRLFCGLVTGIRFQLEGMSGFPAISGSVFQWIEFQIPILKMQVRFLPGLLSLIIGSGVLADCQLIFDLVGRSTLHANVSVSTRWLFNFISDQYFLCQR